MLTVTFHRAARIISFTTFLVVVCPEVMAANSIDIDKALIVKSGLINYSFSGFDTATGANISNASLELVFYPRKDYGIYTGYRLAQDPKSSRSFYQGGFAGVRYYPMTLATPVQSYQAHSLVRYDFRFRPYAELGGTIGRQLVRTLGEPAAADISAEFFGVTIGGGVQTRILDHLHLDFSTVYEHMTGYGPVLFGGSNFLVLLGLLYYP